MVKRAFLAGMLFVIVAASATLAHGDGEEESDFYRLVPVAVSETYTSSRSSNWKPAPDGLALEVS